MRVGQPLEVLNSDPLLHNVRANSTVNEPFNQGQPVQGVQLQAHLRHRRGDGADEVRRPRLDERLDWRGRPPVLRRDRGRRHFLPARLPPGTYAVEAWHEAGGTQSGTVTVPRGHGRWRQLQGTELSQRAPPAPVRRCACPRPGGRRRGRRLPRADQAAPQHAGRDHHAGRLLRGRRAGTPLAELVHTVIGTTLVAGGASAINQVWERDTDRLMRRTRRRRSPTPAWP